VEEVEEWRTCAQCELYAVSNLGQVKRISKSHGSRGGVLKTWKSKRRYHYVSLSDQGVVKDYSVHDLVAAAFVGPKPEDMTVNHIDTDKDNNKASNLEYKTDGDNIRLGFAAGCYPRGSERWNGKLTDDQVREIRAARANGESMYKIAPRYGVTVNVIWAIGKGKTYKHVV
jgi:hypothetical protein